jgi:hypothetical protein
MIFISYAREDHAYACELYIAFEAAGLDPWMDKPPPPHEGKGLQVGQRWASVLNERIRTADYVVLLLSPRSVRKRGYVQVFVIPIVSEDCDVPSLRVGQIDLRDLQWKEVKSAEIPAFVHRLTVDIRGRVR